MVTWHRSYEFQVMSFGLINAPSAFYNMMNDVFLDIIDKFLVMCLNDIVVYS